MSPLTRALWYALIFSLPFTDILFFPETLKNAGQPSTFLVAALWLALFLEFAMRKKAALPNDWAIRPLFWFFAVALASIGMCYWVPVSEFLGNVVWEKSARQLAHFALFASVFLFPAVLIRNELEFHRALRVFLGSVIVVMAYGLLEASVAFFRIDFFEPVLEAFHWGSWYKVPGDSPILFAETPLGEIPRLRLVFAEPSMAGHFLGISFAFLLAYAMSRSSRNWLWGGLALLALCYLILGFSLSGYVLILSLSALFILLLPGTRFRLPYALACAAMALLLLSQPASRSFAAGVLGRPFAGDVSSYVRLESVEAGLRMAIDYPVLGVGFGNSPFYIYDYMAWRPEVKDFLGWYAKYGDIALPVLNLFVRVLAETGVIGGGLFLLWHYRVLRSGWQAVSYAPDKRRRVLGTGAWVACAAVILGYFGESGFDKRYWPFTLGLCLAWARLWLPAAQPAKAAARRRAAAWHHALHLDRTREAGRNSAP